MSKLTERPRVLGIVDSFLKQAPDGGRMTTGNQSQISLAMPRELLDKVDAAAKALNISRAGYIKMCLSNAVKDGS